ncbi:MAG: response regulator [Candidatus Dormibacteraceae bacterium]
MLVDDQALVRAGLRMILDPSPEVDVIGEAADGEAAIELVRRVEPDVVLMDLRMPRLGGVEATRRILALPGHKPRIIALTTFDADEHVHAALKAGATGFLLKDIEPDGLVAGILRAAEGDPVIAPAVMRRVIDAYVKRPERAQFPALATLTDREMQILKRMARGQSNAEIAADLFVAGPTVKSHVASILAKLGLRDRVQAVVLAYEAGIAEPGQ